MSLLQPPSNGFKKPALPLPNRGPSTPSSSTLRPPPSSSTLTPRNSASSSRPGKVQLQPGHSPLDWARLTSSTTTNLRGPPSSPGNLGQGLLKITPSELKRHGRRGDVWMGLNGRVYNCTRYLDFHPGGVGQLMRGAGRDATKMFMEVHSWVNFESMLEKCMVGVLVPEPDPEIEEDEE